MRITAVLVKTCLLLVLISLVACNRTADLNQEINESPGDSSGLDQVDPPVVAEPIIDGIINDQEWQKAALYHFDDGSEVYLMISGNHLYLAIRANGGGMIAGNVFLAEEDRIMILHTSAALGTALYQENGEQYKKIKDFSWCCRSKIDDEASQVAREKFYAEEDWLGINSFLGVENELEYKILLEGQPDVLAVNFIYADDDGDKQVWPVGLKDGVNLPSSGGFPEIIEFSVKDWISLGDIQ